MLEVAARIPDAAARDQFADRLAHKARITEEVVRAEIKKAAAKRETAVAVLDRPKVGLDQVKTAEKGLIWALIHDPAAGAAAVAELERDDLVGLATEPILEQARALQEWPAEALPQTLLERLSSMEARLVEEIGRQPHPPGPPLDCVKAIKRLRYTPRTGGRPARDRPAAGRRRREHETEIVTLWDRKKTLLQLIAES